ncbi:MAG: hypothetical protein KDB94_05550 [Acidobacteria bacterium]|nr:hypothetical protein [Acidobacteriota bacterium]
MGDLVAILALSAVCALWVLVQRWAVRLDPGNPGVVRECGGCRQGRDGAPACQDRCHGRA